MKIISALDHPLIYPENKGQLHMQESMEDRISTALHSQLNQHKKNKKEIAREDHMIRGKRRPFLLRPAPGLAALEAEWGTNVWRRWPASAAAPTRLGLS